MNKKLLFIGALAVLVVAAGTAWLMAAPSIGTTVANPAYVAINTPTSVLITATIADTSVVSSGVNLLKIDSTGKTLATIGTMRDDGTGGDAVAGDKVFSLGVVVNETLVGQMRLQVSAAFRGVVKRVLSPPLILTIDPVRLPPDPGDSGRQTIAGVDTDGDGIRDDVQRYIAYSQPLSEARRAALTQAARTLQESILTAENPTSSLAVTHRIFDSIDCLTAIDSTDGHALHTALKAEVLNTPARSRAYLEADKHFGGQTRRLTPRAERHLKCEFDLAQMED